MTTSEAVPLRSTIPARLDRVSWSPFFASAGASAAYLTVSETWPLFNGALIGEGTSRTGMLWGYVIGGLIMVIGGVVELLIGIKAEGQSLETVTKPLSAVEATPGTVTTDG